MIQAHLGIAYQSYLRGSVNGLEPGDVRGMFGGLRRFKKGVFRNVYLHSVLEKKVTTSTEQVKSQLKQAGFGLELAKATAGKLLKLVHKLDVKKRGSTWSDYRETCSYSDAGASAKQAFVDGVAGAMAPGTVLDLGANDGEYSLIAARHAQQVIAVDADEPTIGAFARRLLAGGPGNVLPLVMDLVDPSPGIGWRNRERAPFPERVRPDLVFSLALVHHLAISANVPLPEVVGWLRSFDAPAVVEFVDRDDPMTKRLLANKPAGLFGDYRLGAFEKLLGEQFSLDKRELLPSGTRTLFLATPGDRPDGTRPLLRALPWPRSTLPPPSMPPRAGRPRGPGPRAPTSSRSSPSAASRSPSPSSTCSAATRPRSSPPAPAGSGSSPSPSPSSSCPPSPRGRPRR